jgi:pimeloyl-ACP methyl ester carboxylesterase
MSYDRSGMGQSDPGGDRSIEGYLAELHAVISATAADRFILVGHSLGGLIALQYAARHSGYVAGLVLVDATPQEIDGNWAVRAGFLISGMLASLFRALSPIGLVRFLLARRRMPLYPEQAVFRAQIPDENYRAWVAEVDRNFAGNAGRELRSVLGVAAAANRTPAAHEHGPEHTLPTVILTSHAYGAKWVGMQQRAAANFQAASHIVLPERSHNIHMSRPELVAEAARQILALAQRQQSATGAAYAGQDDAVPEYSARRDCSPPSGYQRR